MSQTPHQAALDDVLPLIKSLELPYLESLQQLLAEHIAERRQAALAEARARIIQIALRVGMSPEDVLKVTTPPRTGAGQAKYRDPDSGKTWSGLGTVPGWIKGQDRSRFLIEAGA